MIKGKKVIERIASAIRNAEPPMSLREYAAILTGVLTAIFAFDCLWAATKLHVEHVIALSMFAAIGVGLLFMLFADKDEVELENQEPEETSRFVDVGGLNVLIQRSHKKDLHGMRKNEQASQDT